MRVVQLIDSLHAGGAERMAVNISNALSESIERSYLCCSRQEGMLKAFINPSVSYLFLKRKNTLDIKAVLKFYKFLKSEKIDIVHAHSTSFFLATLVKIMLPKVKIVWHNHYGNNINLSYKKRQVLRFCSYFFSSILCVNQNLVHWSKHHLKGNLISYVPNFSVLESVVTSNEVSILKGNLSKRILCLANLRPDKNHFVLLKAFQKICETHDDWTLHCVGQDFNDHYSKAVYDLVNELQLNNSVFFYGSQSDVKKIIKESDIGVLSSNIEGLPLTLLEYGLGKLPVVVTDVGECKHIVSNKDNGILIQPNTSDELVNALQYLIENEEDRILYGERLNNTVINTFSKASIVKLIVQHYNEILL
ncbi:glycosyltransferase [Ichthyenterobacterium magnum]|uniref:Glycosyltransferase involved in cell wall biosynthesis n=1 Tax=Ichthyenterobacterium magnum TaxID=1230530 RepID=A0A420DUI1_9FLAO|nr:glycosyltransferase [Ichthyenterobacterium magnum]RKE97971.1 glycosyltransferase involved in cell wall biosynthesis [Ichthyenterobacterium magnum]